MEDEEGRMIEDVNGTKSWYDKQLRYHRLNGPAVTWANGDKAWFKHGIPHCEDGPACELHSIGIEEWYKDGEPYEPSAHELITWKMKKKEC